MTPTPKQTHDLPFTPPYDWESVLAYFRSHQIPFLETVDGSGYERVVGTEYGLGRFRVESNAGHDSLKLTMWNGSRDDFRVISTTVRRMFDLDINPLKLLEIMHCEPSLSKIWAHHPGLRIARSWDITETLFGAVLGQLVSVAFGRVLMSELMQAAGARTNHPLTSEPIALFPTPREILKADLSGVRTSAARRQTILALAQGIDS